MQMVNGESRCPGCGYAFDAHGLGGNCPRRMGGRKPKAIKARAVRIKPSNLTTQQVLEVFRGERRMPR